MLQMRSNCVWSLTRSFSTNLCHLCVNRHFFFSSVFIAQYVKTLTIAAALTITTHAERWKYIIHWFYYYTWRESRTPELDGRWIRTWVLLAVRWLLLVNILNTKYNRVRNDDDVPWFPLIQTHTHLHQDFEMIKITLSLQLFPLRIFHLIVLVCLGSHLFSFSLLEVTVFYLRGRRQAKLQTFSC